MDFTFELYNNKSRNKIYSLWYEIYVSEMNRNIKYLDKINKTIIDPLEPNSDIIIAKYNEQIIGTVRVNTNYNLNPYYNELYELNKLKNSKIGVITKYMIKKDFRNTRLSILLAIVMKEYCKKINIDWMLIDCSPNLYNYFEKMGFENYLGIKNHIEYGEVKILKYFINSKNNCVLNNKRLINISKTMCKQIV